MNRRGFLSSLIAVPVAAWMAPTVLTTSAPNQLYFKGIPIVFDSDAPYHVTIFNVGAYTQSRKLGVITAME